MLEELNITNLGIVNNTSLPLTKGLNVITGETGAGKSMILDGLGLLLGKRSKSSLVGLAKDHLVVEGCWYFEDVPDFLEETAVTIEDGNLFVARTVKNDGKSKSLVGGRNMPTSVLSEISSQLVNIHGQSDQLKLKSSTIQLDILDKFGKEHISPRLETYKTTYNKWVKLKKTIKDFQDNQTMKEIERKFYTEVVSNYEKLAPENGENVDLENEILKLENVDKLKEHLLTAQTSLNQETEYGSIEISSSIYEMLNQINKAVMYDDSLKETQQRAEEIYSLLNIVESSIETYISGLDYEALERLNEAQERLNQIKSLIKKYNQGSLEDLTEYYVAAQQWLIDNPSAEDIEEVLEEVKALEKELQVLARSLSEERVKTAKILSEQMNEALQELNMGNAIFLIENSTIPFGSTGNDAIEFMLKAHKKATSSPINKTASGGELSRIMLALETVVATKEKNIATFVFDEVDSGVGGEAAVQIGKRLAKLAQNAQVIVVTHLPQVASFADNHLIVVKTDTETEVSTEIKQLKADDKRKEIARMLSGFSESETGISHADELLSFATKYKNDLT